MERGGDYGRPTRDGISKSGYLYRVPFSVKKNRVPFGLHRLRQMPSDHESITRGDSDLNSVCLRKHRWSIPEGQELNQLTG
jgi:hypothetical protein